MPGIKKEVEEYIHNVKKYSVKTGCTLMYNIWPSRKSCIKTFSTYKNIFAYTPRGLACMDPSEDPIEELFLFEKAMSSIVEEIGPRHVVQFIINNDSDDSDVIRSTKDMLKKYPWIYTINCATHGIGLLLEKIYNISFVYNTVQVAKLIVTYIFKHNVSVPLRRVHKRREDYISFEICMLISLLEVGDKLQALQVSIITLSTDWGRTPNYKQVGELLKGARLIDHAIHCKEFWIRGKKIAQVLRPMLQALCLVDGDGATSGYLYEMMERVKDAIMQCHDNTNFPYDHIWDIFHKRRSDIIHPIHAVAAFLNPAYMYSEKFKENVELANGLKFALKHLVDEEEKEAFINQAQLYHKKDSNLFTDQAITMLKTSHPRESITSIYLYKNLLYNYVFFFFFLNFEFCRYMVGIVWRSSPHITKICHSDFKSTLWFFNM